MNREAAQARLELLEQAIPKLHEDLQRAQEQLVQSRMEVSARPRYKMYHYSYHPLQSNLTDTCLPLHLSRLNKRPSRWASTLKTERDMEMATIQLPLYNIIRYGAIRTVNYTTVPYP